MAPDDDTRLPLALRVALWIPWGFALATPVIAAASDRVNHADGLLAGLVAWGCSFWGWFTAQALGARPDRGIGGPMGNLVGGIPPFACALAHAMGARPAESLRFDLVAGLVVQGCLLLVAQAIHNILLGRRVARGRTGASAPP